MKTIPDGTVSALRAPASEPANLSFETAAESGGPAAGHLEHSDKLKIHRRFYPELNVGGFSRVDGTIAFYQRVNALLRPDDVVIDYGAGRGLAHSDDVVPFRRELTLLRGKVRKVIGADVDPIVTTNPGVDEAVVIDATGGGSCRSPTARST